MPRYSKSFIKVKDPYSLLALNVFLEAFRDIECYFNGIGSDEERIEGKKSVEWMRRMKGNFRILALAGDSYSTEEFHDLCVRKINQLKKEAYERCQLRKQNRESSESREGDSSLVQEELRPQGGLDGRLQF